MLDQFHPNKVRQVLFITFLLLMGILIAVELFFILGAFLGAVTMYVLLRNLMIKLVVEYKWKKWLSALVLMLGVLVMIVLPMWWLGSVIFDAVNPVIQNPQIINTTFNQIQVYLNNNFDIDLSSLPISSFNEKLIPFGQSMLGSTFSTLGNVLIMFFILYFMLTQIQSIELWLRRNVPFKNSNVTEVLSETRRSIYSNAVGIPVVAVAQGLAGLIGYVIFGVEAFVLMGALTAVASVIPVIGSAMIYIPLALYQLSTGETWQGIGIIIWGTAVIGSVDNVVRFWLQKRMANTHPLVTIFGVMIGIPLFGFLGVIFGPLLLSLFFLLVKVYVDEYGVAELD